MSARNTFFFHFILYLSLIVPFVILYRANPEQHVLIACLCSSFAGLQLLRYRVLQLEMISLPSMILLFIQWVIVFFIQIIDGSFVPQIYFFILLSEAALRAPVAFSAPFTFICYLGFAFGSAVHLSFPPFEEIIFIIPRSLEYVLIFGFSYVTKKVTDQKEKLDQAYDRLKKANRELEEKTLIEERVRISREIHDTIGHTLTTALVGMEASKQLVLHHQTEQAIDKLDQVKQQVKKSLEDIRKSVRTLHEKKSFVHFKDSLTALINETMKYSEVDIKYTIPQLPPLSPQKELAIYRALQEGLTNGIRHGQAQQFKFSLFEENDHLHFLLIDNGNMPKNWRYGFGLTSMMERVHSLEGALEITRNQYGGCQLYIRIPVRSNAKSLLHMEGA